MNTSPITPLLRLRSTHVALAPRDCALVGGGAPLIGLALDAEVHDVVAADCALLGRRTGRETAMVVGIDGHPSGFLSRLVMKESSTYVVNDNVPAPEAHSVPLWAYDSNNNNNAEAVSRKHMSD